MAIPEEEAAAAEAAAGTNFIPPSHFHSREVAMMNYMVMVGGTSFPAPNPNSLPFSAADSGLTTNNNNVPSYRKRSRDDCHPFPNDSPSVPFGYQYHNNDGSSGGGCASQRTKSMTMPPWFEQEATLQMQTELDSLIAQHTQRLRVEVGERARQQAKALASVIRGAVATKLREKEEEIQRVAKLNWGLQERVRSLCAENQLWRGLAQSNEAAANSLRKDLERVLRGRTGGVEENNGDIPAAAGNEGVGGGDAESCCGSNEEEEGRRCKVCEGRLEETSEGVVVMPCRHVFMQCKRCSGGSSRRQSCPVCGSQITATLHVNLPN